uniref:Uncharacterized protein n=1 Tax=Panagrolaimus sp. JU765 TaxID=591449 RepID=A0AC34QVX5_9BILA
MSSNQPNSLSNHLTMPEVVVDDHLENRYHLHEPYPSSVPPFQLQEPSVDEYELPPEALCFINELYSIVESSLTDECLLLPDTGVPSTGRGIFNAFDEASNLRPRPERILDYYTKLSARSRHLPANSNMQNPSMTPAQRGFQSGSAPATQDFKSTAGLNNMEEQSSNRTLVLTSQPQQNLPTLNEEELEHYRESAQYWKHPFAYKVEEHIRKFFKDAPVSAAQWAIEQQFAEVMYNPSSKEAYETFIAMVEAEVGKIPEMGQINQSAAAQEANSEEESNDHDYEGEAEVEAEDEAEDGAENEEDIEMIENETENDEDEEMDDDVEDIEADDEDMEENVETEEENDDGNETENDDQNIGEEDGSILLGNDQVNDQQNANFDEYFNANVNAGAAGTGYPFAGYQYYEDPFWNMQYQFPYYNAYTYPQYFGNAGNAGIFNPEPSVTVTVKMIEFEVKFNQQ